MASSSPETSFEPASVERRRAYLAGLEPFFHVVASVEELDDVGVDEYGHAACPRTGAARPAHRRRPAPHGVVAMDATCPHRGADLGLGWVNDACDAVVCRYHGFEWGADGAVCRIPALEATGRSLPTGAGWRVETFPTVVRYGLVWVCLAAEPRLPVIDLPEAEDDDFRSLPQPTETWRAMCGRMVEASLDTYHFAFAHRSSIGDPSLPAAPVAHVVHPTTPTHRVRHRAAGRRGGDLRHGRRRGRARQSCLVTGSQSSRPSSSMMKTTGDVAFAALLAMHPRRAEETTAYRRIYPHRELGRRSRRVQRTQAQVFAEDRLVVESQRPWELTTDLDAELHASMDRPTVGYRRWLASLGIVLLVVAQETFERAPDMGLEQRAASPALSGLDRREDRLVLTRLFFPGERRAPSATVMSATWSATSSISSRSRSFGQGLYSSEWKRRFDTARSTRS